MKAKDLIAKLQELDPEEEVWLWDRDYLADPVQDVERLHNGRGTDDPEAHWFIT